VPAAEQAVALEIYKAGNAEFEESRYAQALAKYREALQHWDHPGIRFNMAVCLVHLDRPLEALEHLEQALKYGDAPIGAEMHSQGLTYRKLLLGQLAHVTVKCQAKAANVTFDGQPLMECPGEAKKLVTPGPHQVVASKPGFLTQAAPLVLLPGKEHVHVVELAPIGAKLVRRWKARTPWIVVGAGGALAALGGVSLYLARSEYDTYDQLLAAQCPSGCNSEMPEGMREVRADTLAHERKGKIANIAGVSLLGVGCAVAIAGLVGVYLNLPRSVVEQAPAITPAASSTGAGATLSWTF